MSTHLHAQTSLHTEIDKRKPVQCVVTKEVGSWAGGLVFEMWGTNDLMIANRAAQHAGRHGAPGFYLQSVSERQLVNERTRAVIRVLDQVARVYLGPEVASPPNGSMYYKVTDPVLGAPVVECDPQMWGRDSGGRRDLP